MLRVEYEVVSLGPEVDGGFLAEENECEDVSVLKASCQHGLGGIRDTRMMGGGRVEYLTFAWHWAKNLSGSIPYVTVLPMMGSQWNTSGGSWAFLRNSCRTRFVRMAMAMSKAPVPASFNAISERPVMVGTGTTLLTMSSVAGRHVTEAPSAACAERPLLLLVVVLLMLVVVIVEAVSIATKVIDRVASSQG